MPKRFFGFVLLLWAQPMNGTYFINGLNDPPNRQYATIQDALNDLAARGAQDQVWLRVVHPYDPVLEPATIRVRPYACQNCDVVLMVDTPITIAKSPPAEWWLGQFVLRIQGGVQRFTLNGRGRLTLKCLTDTTAFMGVVGLLTSTAGGISNIRIDSCIIEGRSREKTSVAIYIGDSAGPIMRPVSANVNQITISACTLRSTKYGAVFLAGGWGPLNQITLYRCVIGYPTTNLAQADSSWYEAGVFAQFATNLTIDSTLIEGSWHTGPKTPIGIHVDRCNNVYIRRNTIRNLRSLSEEGFGAIGIRCIRQPAFGAAPHFIENNFIAGLLGSADETLPGSSNYAVAGILLESLAPDPSATFTLRHNTIHLYGNAESAASWAKDGFSAGVILGSNIRGGVELSNNLIQNTLHLRSLAAPDAKETCALVFWDTLSRLQWNTFTFRHNFYYLEGEAPERTFLARIGASSERRSVGSLAEWRTLTNLDLSSQWGIAGGAPFVSPEMPHIQPNLPWNGINSAYAPPLTLEDIEGDSRPQSGPNDPGTAPDIGADELSGTVLPCPIPASQPLSASALSGLVGEKIDITVSNPSALAGELFLAWTVDGRQTWHTLSIQPQILPWRFPLPEPPTFPGQVELRLVALPPPGCPGSPDSSAPLYLSITDRPGNRPANAIPLSLSSNGAGLWSISHTDSISGPGLTDVYSPRNHPSASLSKELFFRITLPECIDSLDIDLCSALTDFDSRLHLVGNLDTITDRDQGPRLDCSPNSIPASFTSRIVAMGNSQRDLPAREDFTQPARPKLPLAPGSSFFVVVEGETPLDIGKFILSVKAYKLPLSKPDLGPDRNACLSPTGIRLSGFVPGANAYHWYVNGQLLSGQTDSFIVLLLPLGTHTIVVEARREPLQLCAPLLTARDTLQLTIIPSLNARLRYGTQTLDNGDTLRLPFGTHTLSAEAQSGNTSYIWRIWNSRGILIDQTSGPTYGREWGETGYFLIELQSQTPECTETDSVWIAVGIPSEPNSLAYQNTTTRLYPNPTSGILYIETQTERRVYVYDLAGKLIEAYDLHRGGIHQLFLSVPAGSYLLRFWPSGSSILLRIQP
ncbi:MAG: hypothetical protein N3E49_02560 [Bacteroidia bacterium]|nr:hypothetical protein [Bacteroidia bacterium]